MSAPPTAVPHPPGLLGARGLGPGDAQRLDHWLRGLGARPAGGDEECRVWRIGEPFGGLAAATAGGTRAWLLGDLFQAPSDGCTDADGALALYRQRGHALIWDLVGQYALILWDSRRHELALFRDGSSAQGLYYARRPDGSILFADRLGLLAGCPLLSRRVSRAALHEYLRFFDISTPRTIFDGILSCEPDRLYLHDRHGLHVIDAPPPSATAPPTDLPGAAAELDRRMQAAVEERLSRSGTTIAFLSGGVDSAYLCALAAARAPGRVRALTVGFDQADADESAVAGRIAAHLGVPHQVLRFGPDACRDAFDALAAGAEQPSADPAGIPTLLAFRAARATGDVALDGTGADTQLGIMPARHQRIAVAWSARLPRRLRQIMSAAVAPLPVVRDYRPLLDFDDPQGVLMRWPGFALEDIAALCGEPPRLAESRFYRLFERYGRHAHFARYSALIGNLPDDRIHFAAALTGLRVRFPYVAPGVAWLIGALPRELRWRPEESKRVLKAALSGRVPRPLWDVPKHGFDFPFTDLLLARDAELVRTWLAPETVRTAGLLDPAPVQALAEAFLAGDRRDRFRVWGLAVLFAWLGTQGL